jgi:hypothetical protein
MLLFVALSPHIVINSDVRLRSRRGTEMGKPRRCDSREAGRGTGP